MLDSEYTLVSDHLILHEPTNSVRPYLNSGLPIPFKHNDRVRVIIGSKDFPLGSEYIVEMTEGHDAIYCDGKPCSWERLVLIENNE